MSVDAIKTMIKRALLPDRTVSLRTPFGLVAPQRMCFNPQHELRRYFGLYERELKPYFRKLVRRGDKCFDVGANSGYYALALCNITGSRVVAFESDQAALAVLQMSRQTSGLDITIVRSFVDDRDEVGHITLDCAAERYFVPEFVKMDIEGGEVAALRGASKLISHGATRFIIEVHGVDIESSCLDAFASASYDIEIVNPSRIEVTQRGLAHNRWLVAVPKSVN
jgi:hypothetical protein